MPSLHIRLTTTAYLPEANAYEKYLGKRGWNVTSSVESATPECDLELLFPGYYPFWQNASRARRFIYDYTSSSVPPFSVAKNLFKSSTERPPHGRIFLSEFVRSCFRFHTARPYIVRDMGIDDEIFVNTRSSKPAFDIIYAGSIQGRNGLIETLNFLSEMGCKILLVGETLPEQKDQLHRSITLTGRVPRADLPTIYSSAKFGLNFTPNIHPFNMQTSTKTLEYLAAGLGVISTRGTWIEKFSHNRNANFLWLDDLKTRDQLDQFVISPVSVRDLSWENVLANSQLERFVSQIIK